MTTTQKTLVDQAREDFRCGLRNLPQHPTARELYLEIWNSLRDANKASEPKPATP